jgi:hypothetical protein
MVADIQVAAVILLEAVVVAVHGVAVEEAEMAVRQEQVVAVEEVEEVVTEDNNLLLPLYVILIP